MAWFGRKNDSPDTAPVNLPTIITVPFHEQMTAWLDELAWYERECSAIISPAAFSKLRVISDVLTEIASFLENYPVRAEDEYIIQSTITNYIPSTLNIFNQLPAHERVIGSEADNMLLSQCENIERSVRTLNKDMHERVKSNFATQTIFVENRFAHQP